ncbi:MAG: hypothetical protein AMXMBFR57_26920 [Acidimicrobiia bacterium]
MSAEPYAWNVVVVGAWNMAILSPDGVSKRLFDLPGGTPIQLEVALDRPGRFKVSHDGILVVPASNRLEIAPEACVLEELKKAAAIGQRAVEKLPETPVTAAGVNIRYRFQELPVSAANMIRTPLDDALADRGFVMRNADIVRVVELEQGLVTVRLSSRLDGTGTLDVNFNRDSTVPAELSEWLGRLDQFFDVARQLSDAAGAAVEDHA